MDIMWVKHGKAILNTTHLRMVNIPPIYGDDWGMVYDCFSHMILFAQRKYGTSPLLSSVNQR